MRHDVICYSRQPDRLVLDCGYQLIILYQPVCLAGVKAGCVHLCRMTDNSV